MARRSRKLRQQLLKGVHVRHPGATLDVPPVWCRLPPGDVVPLLLRYEKTPTAMHLVYPSPKRDSAKVGALSDFLIARCRVPAAGKKHER
jgi:hypothetical protein